MPGANGRLWITSMASDLAGDEETVCQIDESIIIITE